jgi:Tfp pilus assembly protein PilE
VVRGVSILSLLAAVLVAGWLLTAQQRSGAAEPSQVVDQARQAATGLTFQQAQIQLEQFHARNGTYAGASTAGSGATLARADDSSYCIQATAGGTTSHLAGPGGTPAAGSC